MDNANTIEMPVEFGDKAHEAVMSIIWTSNVLRKNSKYVFQDYLASEVQFNILSLLYESTDDLTQNDLSKLLLVDKSNITGLIDRLEKMLLIERKKVKGDRRKYHIILTDEGRELVAELDEIYMATIHKITEDFDSSELETMIKLTKKLRKGLSKMNSK